MKKASAILIDLDGTLANCDHRRHFVERESGKDWKSFYDNMHLDTANEWCKEIVLKFSQEMAVIFVTGRPENYRSKTIDWIFKNIASGVDVEKLAIVMRREGDFRADYIVKKEIYLEEIHPHYDILFVIDDRQSVVDMWRRNGLVCLQCAPGDF